MVAKGRVADQERDPNSLLNFYRRMLHLRKAMPALVAGDYAALHNHAQDYLAFTRSARGQTPGSRGQTCLVALNFSEQPQTVQFDLAQRKVRCLFSTAKEDGLIYELAELPFSAFEVLIGELIGE